MSVGSLLGVPSSWVANFSLCAVLPHRSKPPFWARDAGFIGASLRVSEYDQPFHYFDWPLVRDCAWGVFVLDGAYVDLLAMLLRLKCLDPQEVLILGRVGGRGDYKYPVVLDTAFASAHLAAGLVVSAGAIKAFGEQLLSKCRPPTFSFIVQKTTGDAAFNLNVSTIGDITAVDMAFCVCLAYAGVPSVQPFGHYAEHFVLGPWAAERLLYRRFFNDNIEHINIPYKQRPCVMVVYPVSPEDEFLLAGGRGYCSATLGEYFFNASNTYMIMEEDNTVVSLNPVVETHMRRCGIVRFPYLKAYAYPDTVSLTNVSLVLLAGLPGGATSWFYAALADSMQIPVGERHGGYFYPYCNEGWRVELSYFTGSTEDHTFVNIYRERINALLFDNLARRMIYRAVSERQSAPATFFTRENVNVLRMPDFARIGFSIVALYRHRQHTFPLSDPGGMLRGHLVEGDGHIATLCRTCFYLQMYYAMGHGDVSDPVLKFLQQFITLVDGYVAKQVVIHSMFWFIMLRLQRLHGYAFAIIDYGKMIFAASEEIEQYLASLLPPRLSAKALAGAVVTSRQSPEWLRAREARYASDPELQEAERWVQRLLAELRVKDPETDARLLA